MARAFGVPVSRSAVLRLLDALPEPEVPAPRVVGVDEYATRKGRVYGTVLVDVETRRPMELLPDRDASSLAAWLAKRPGIEIVCRDRAPFFTEGATVLTTASPCRSSTGSADSIPSTCGGGDATTACSSVTPVVISAGPELLSRPRPPDAVPTHVPCGVEGIHAAYLLASWSRTLVLSAKRSTPPS
ncbi:transposase [Streptomyces sp. NPDC060334]|uniref:transposase n=1 Tax=unclassified Streptomyces TaxID=2593676 RepID=UPI00364690B6